MTPDYIFVCHPYILILSGVTIPMNLYGLLPFRLGVGMKHQMENAQGIERSLIEKFCASLSNYFVMELKDWFCSSYSLHSSSSTFPLLACLERYIELALDISELAPSKGAASVVPNLLHKWKCNLLKGCLVQASIMVHEC